MYEPFGHFTKSRLQDIGSMLQLTQYLPTVLQPVRRINSNALSPPKSSFRLPARSHRVLTLMSSSCASTAFKESHRLAVITKTTYNALLRNQLNPYLVL